MVNHVRKPPDLPVDNDRPMKVVCIGAGHSRILTAIRFPQKIQNLQLTALPDDAQNVTWCAISCGIKTTTETGIEDNNGNNFEVDAIVCATGFEASYEQNTAPIRGIGGITLGQLWDPNPEVYMSLCTPKMPNLFFLIGPNSAPTGGSFIYLLEWYCEYIINCVKKLQREYISSMVVTDRANAAFSVRVEEYFLKTIFPYKCSTWFKRHIPDGRVVALWPGSSPHAVRCLESPRVEDFEYAEMPQMQQNPLNWMGNEFTVAQQDGAMTTGYLDKVDVPPMLNKIPRDVVQGRTAEQRCLRREI